MAAKDLIKAVVKRNRRLFSFAKWCLKIRDQFISKKIAGINNRIQSEGVSFGLKYEILGDNNLIYFSKGSICTNIDIFIRGNNNRIEIGENCIYKSGAIWIEDDENLLYIEDGTTIESAAFLMTENSKKIKIGKDCLISTGVVCRTGDSHTIVDINTNQRINYAKNVILGNHVWIGSDVKILKGSVIGDNSIIGSSSVVSGVIDASSVAVGIPAKVIKTGVNWLRERI